MLIVTRKLGEDLELAEGITVRLLKMRGDLVHLGVTVPRVISMHEQELRLELDAEQLSLEEPENLKSDLTIANEAKTVPAMKEHKRSSG